MPPTPADILTYNVDKNLKTACLVISDILNMLSGGSLVLTKYANGLKSCRSLSLLLDGEITSMY